VATFSIRSPLWPVPPIPKYFYDGDLERAFVQRRRSLLRHRILFLVAMCVLIWLPRTIVDHMTYSRGWASRSSVLNAAARAVALGCLGLACCACLLCPKLPLEKVCSGLTCTITVCTLFLSKKRITWLCGETMQEAFNMDMQSDSLIVAAIMVICALFFQMPVRVTRSWTVVIFVPAAYFVSSLPVPGLDGDGSAFRVASLGAMLAFLTGTMFVNQVFSETAERANFAHQIVLREQVTKERVLRYQAEHEAELGPLSMLHGAGRSCAPPVAISVQDHKSELSSLKPHSAPPTCLLQTPAPCKSGDCVPEDYLVETNSSSTPQKLSSLSVGQEVLCYDRLSSQTRFVKIIASKVSDQSDSTLRAIALEDGTVVEATSDHPMPAGQLGGGTRAGIRTVAAGKLRAGMHTLTCFKRMDLAITSISKQASSKKVVSLSVQQPNRFGILMSPPSQPTDYKQSMLVFGSSDAMTMSSKNTFVQMDWQSELSSITIKRSSSAPAIMNEAAQDCREDGGTHALPEHCRMQPGRKCKLCNFHRRYTKSSHADPCSKGALCDFCHHD